MRLRQNEDVTLEEVALAVDIDQNPGIDPEHSRSLLDELALRAAGRIDSLRDPGGRVLTLVDFLHREERFRGHTEAHLDPRNSYLHQVLESRNGIPLTLCIVTIEVGRRLGIPIHGISFPRHFLARATGNVDLIIDAFAGRTLTDGDCSDRLKQAMGPGATFDRRRLRAATPREVLLRMLGNLKHVHIVGRRYSQAAECCARMLLAAPELLGELRDRGILHEHLELYGAAIADYEKFLDSADAEPSAQTIRARCNALRQRVH
ncbi:MAG: tetratricopeptide repeat protein [bacterium]|nr:tetratricopeptide repeat protein [bacterium]